jgi:hypothetical protein
MATGMALPLSSGQTDTGPIEPSRRLVIIALAVASVFVCATRWPVARVEPFEYDEFSFLDQAAAHWFPMHHTLFMTFGRILGFACGDAYRGFVVLDMLTSAGALVSVWWMLRSLVSPTTAAAAALVLGVGPIFWGYGAMAGNYTAIVLVGAFLLGIAYRGRSCPRPWHPYAAAVVLAVGTGYRPDIGTLWLAVFFVILWQNRWKRAVWATLLFTILNLAWLSAMLNDAGGWSHYRAVSAEYAYECGYRNSIWYLGFVDAPVRYSVKLGMALVWTLGPALLFVPAGLTRLRRFENGGFIAALMAVATLPALGSHLLVQFGSPGWCFHYLPVLIALVALGVSHARVGEFAPSSAPNSQKWTWPSGDPAPARLIAMGAVLAATFWFYPTDFDRPGWRGSFDLSFCRFTRIGLKTPILNRSQQYWRTANSRPPGADATPARESSGRRG